MKRLSSIYKLYIEWVTCKKLVTFSFVVKISLLPEKIELYECFYLQICLLGVKEVLEKGACQKDTEANLNELNELNVRKLEHFE